MYKDIDLNWVILVPTEFKDLDSNMNYISTNITEFKLKQLKKQAFPVVK